MIARYKHRMCAVLQQCILITLFTLLAYLNYPVTGTDPNCSTRACGMRMRITINPHVSALFSSGNEFLHVNR